MFNIQRIKTKHINVITTATATATATITIAHVPN